MRNFHKPLFIIGIILSSIGSFLWLIFTIINIVVINNSNLNVRFPTAVGILGVVSIILSFLLPEFIRKSDKSNKKDDETIERL